MPRVTIKSLEVQITTLRELRASDQSYVNNCKAQLKMTEDRVKELGKEVDELRKDKAYFKMIVDKLSTPRTTNALPR